MFNVLLLGEFPIEIFHIPPWLHSPNGLGICSLISPALQFVSATDFCMPAFQSLQSWTQSLVVGICFSPFIMYIAKCKMTKNVLSIFLQHSMPHLSKLSSTLSSSSPTFDFTPLSLLFLTLDSTALSLFSNVRFGGELDVNWDQDSWSIPPKSWRCSNLYSCSWIMSPLSLDSTCCWKDSRSFWSTVPLSSPELSARSKGMTVSLSLMIWYPSDYCYRQKDVGWYLDVNVDDGVFDQLCHSSLVVVVVVFLFLFFSCNVWGNQYTLVRWCHHVQ